MLKVDIDGNIIFTNEMLITNISKNENDIWEFRVILKNKVFIFSDRDSYALRYKKEQIEDNVKIL